MVNESKTMQLKIRTSITNLSFTAEEPSPTEEPTALEPSVNGFVMPPNDLLLSCFSWNFMEGSGIFGDMTNDRMRSKQGQFVHPSPKNLKSFC